jgi:transposase InsO family protein
MRFQFIDDHRAEFAVQVMCEVLAVSRSGYYAWRQRRPGSREMANQDLVGEIRTIYQQSRQTYGSPRIYRELRDNGVKCSENRVARLMRLNDIRAIQSRRFKVVTTDANHTDPIAPNLLDQDFTADDIDQIWLADITYIPTAAGWLYLAVVLDLYSRRIVGWAMADTLERQLAIDALQMAIFTRKPPPGLIHHSDRGSQYASDDYQTLLTKHQILCSMSRSGNCYDNAPMESFFGTLKTEWVHHQHYRSHAQAKSDLFEYIEVFYNRVRRHSALAYLNPVQFEALALAA